MVEDKSFKISTYSVELLKELLKSEYKEFIESSFTPPYNSIRCNTLKINPDKLRKRLESKWKIRIPFPSYPEIMIVDNNLKPGELGKSIEHILGYYYIQELSSMMPVLALNPRKEDVVLDLCASPGSKTTQIAAFMENSGVLIANDVSIGRIVVLCSNIQRCGVTNSVVTRNEGVFLCNRLNKLGFVFNKILVDAPCSCMGTSKNSSNALSIVSEKIVEKMSRIQKNLVLNAFKILKSGGELVYSTCTYPPEENEEVVNYVIEKTGAELVKIELPIKTRDGLVEWKGSRYNKNMHLCKRIYPHDNNTEGFFIAKLRKVD